ncbi:HNH endonuclease [Luteimonas sp. RIT-PG2_3]
MKIRHNIDESELLIEIQKTLAYCPDTGNLFRRPKPGSRHWSIAGTKRKDGYAVLKITVGGRKKNVLAHRAAWAVVNGVWPTHQIDHVDGDPGNNRISNLREATGSLNQQNRRKQKPPASSRFMGVSWSKSASKWQARIQPPDCKRISLGFFDTEESAAAAYVEAKRPVHTFMPDGHLLSNAGAATTGGCDERVEND